MLNTVSFKSIIYTYCLNLKILASGPMIETMMQWKPLIAFGATPLLSTIWYCLNLWSENSRPKLTSPKDNPGKTKNIALSLWK